MAALPANTTARVFFDYITGTAATSREHTLAVRFAAPGTTATVQARLLAVLNALTAARFRDGWRIVRARLQNAGSDFSVPLIVDGALAAFVGTSTVTYAPRLEAVESTFQGRSNTDGRRVDLSLYRAQADASDNFRITSGGAGINAAVAAAVSALNASGGANGSFLTISGSEALWYSYMNENYNSYWESRSRTV